MEHTNLLRSLSEALRLTASAISDAGSNMNISADDISLLDTKSDLLFSYLQNLTLLLVFKLKSFSGELDSRTNQHNLPLDVIGTLVELRAYLDRGVRPLEGKLKYQIDRAVQAAESMERAQKQHKRGPMLRNGTFEKQSRDRQISEEGPRSVSDSDRPENEVAFDNNPAESKIDDLSYRPNPAAFLSRTRQSATTTSAAPGLVTKSSTSETYRPPRINPTAMPESGAQNSIRSEKRARKSHLLDEYASTELSSLPVAEPSVGSNATILTRGRDSLSTTDRDREKERVEYEESNFARLPKPSKAERAKAGKRRQHNVGDQFGGEDWKGLGDIGDKVARSIGKASKQESAWERRSKRRKDMHDNDHEKSIPLGIGENFEKRKRLLQRQRLGTKKRS